MPMHTDTDRHTLTHIYIYIHTYIHIYIACLSLYSISIKPVRRTITTTNWQLLDTIDKANFNAATGRQSAPLAPTLLHSTLLFPSFSLSLSHTQSHIKFDLVTFPSFVPLMAHFAEASQHKSSLAQSDPCPTGNAITATHSPLPLFPPLPLHCLNRRIAVIK